jgi:hypothetical protein
MTVLMGNVWKGASDSELISKYYNYCHIKTRREIETKMLRQRVYGLRGCCKLTKLPCEDLSNIRWFERFPYSE